MAQGASTSEDQFLFLISCIKNAKNGKPDFELVAKERGIVNRAAASKRYHRLMRAHGVDVQATPKKGVKSPPLTDEDDSVKPEEAKDEDVFKSSPSSKRKRGGQVIRGRAAKKTKREPKDDNGSEVEEEADNEWF
ncbi:hypothetical protein ABW21_db0208134 [Orbilia brochopaga]|nr:hypothetical protein ABW21_db0208134 [Drechslerella brochopaga]